MNLESHMNIDGAPELKPETLNANLSEDLQLIDVRRPDEFNAELGHIQGAKLLTLGPELEAKLPKLNKDVPIVFICRSGARSSSATLMAKEMGFQKVYNLQGGMLRWNALGFSISKE